MCAIVDGLPYELGKLRFGQQHVRGHALKFVIGVVRSGPVPEFHGSVIVFVE
jgi:hypothetical protein